MIRLIENTTKEELEKLTAFAETDCLGVRALGPLLAYGTGYDFLDAWVQETDEITAFITRFYGAVTVCAGEGADRDEIEEFLAVLGVSDFTANFEKGRKNVMKLERGGDCKALPVTNCNCIENSNYKAFYDIISECHDDYDAARFEDWYVDMSHRVRHGTADIFLLACADAEGTNSFVSAAAALSVTPHCVFLSAISTLPQYRGRHFAHTLIRSVCGKYADRTVYLLCDDDKVPFYEKAGFHKESEC